MRTIIVLLLSIISLVASEIKWEKSYAEAVAKAKAQQKPIMFIVSNHHCRFCIIFESKTLKDSKIVQKLNIDFVNAIVYIDENPIFPRYLNVPGTPGTWFLKSDGEPMFEPLMGAIEGSEFTKALEIVKQEYKKNGNKKEIK